MTEFTLISPAKINLGLIIGPQCRDHYHDVTNILHRLPLADELQVTLLPDQKNDELCCTHAAVPLGEDNLILRALRLLHQDYQFPAVRVTLTKNIPVGSGLAGGSSNAGTLLAGLNDKLNLGLSASRLQALSLALGADVNFFAQPAPCLLERHHGLINLSAKTLPSLPRCQITLVYQDFSLDTAAMYAAYDQFACDHEREGVTGRLRCLLDALEARDLSAIAAHLHNDFETLVFRRHPHLFALKKQLLAAGALGSCLTGKGPTLFALFPADTHPDLASIPYPTVTYQLESSDVRA